MAIYKRPGSKYYWYKFTFDGELIQQSSKCKNKADARTVRDAHRTQLALGKIGIKPKKEIPTFEKAVEDFLKFSEVEHANKQATVSRYSFSCVILKQFFKKKKVSAIDSDDVKSFIVWRSKQKSSKTKKFIARRTVNFDLLVLKMIFRRLVEDEVLIKSPAQGIKRLAENENTFHVLTGEEEKRYLLACPQPLKDVAALILETGMRCAEVYQLQRSEIYIEQNYLKVTKGKTRSAIRRVHLSEKAREILAYRLNKFDGRFLFPQNEIDGAEQTDSLHYLHLKTVRRLKFDFRLYDCRHTFATRAVESGVDLLTLASILGHGDLKTVTRYAHPSEEHKAEAVRKIEKAGKRAKAV